MINTPITACVLTQNAERSIRASLESLAWCEEVVVLDARSTDRTRDIAADCGARVVPGHGGTSGAHRQIGVREATHEWILFLRADERPSPELARELLRRKLYGLGEFAAYEVPFVSTYFGHAMRHGDWSPDHRIRLFNRRRAVFADDSLQERVISYGPVGRLRGHVLHDTYQDLDHQLDKLRRHASLMAEVIAENGRHASVSRMLFDPLWRFLRAYLLRGGYRDGWRGLAVAQIEANFAWEKQLRLYVSERQRAQPDAR